MPATRHRPRLLAAAGLLLVASCGVPVEAGGSVPAPSATSAGPAPVVGTGAPEPAVTEPVAPEPTTPEPEPVPVPVPVPVPEPEPEPAPGPGTALAALATLEVKGRAPRTGYDRDLFGQAWADVDRNGCDTRNDVLRRDLVDVVLDARTDGCVVLSGLLDDPYTGDVVDFARGVDTSADVQVDHVVALSDAWQKGAQQWDDGRREAFANDPLNLLAVDGPTNQAKGDGDAATWLPPDRGVRCSYVARQVAVKADHGLWVTAAERDAVARVLGDCPDEPLPTAVATATPPRGGGRDVAGVADRDAAPAAPAAAPAAAPEPAPVAEPDPPGDGTDPRFETCRAALAAGYGEYVRGVDVEYDWYRDGDGDGVACEG